VEPALAVFPPRAPTPQTLGGASYAWVSSSDGGAQSHNVVANAAATYTAAYANQPPITSATGAPTNGPAPLTVNFDGTGSSDPDGSRLTFAWDLDGDGGFDDSTSVQPTYIYTQPGTYNARLRVTDAQNQSAASAPVTISANNTASPPQARTSPWRRRMRSAVRRFSGT
jgi:PKD repeat protein